MVGKRELDIMILNMIVHYHVGAVVVAQEVEHTPASKNLEVMGSNPARCWAFFLSSLSYQECVLNSDPSQRCNTSDFPIEKYASPCSLRQNKLNKH